MINEAATRLLQGADGANVVAQLRVYCAQQSNENECKVTTLNRMLTHVRGRVMEQFSPDLSTLEVYPETAEFLAKPLSDQVAIQRSNNWSGEAKAALEKIALLPSGMQNFRLNDAERAEFEGLQSKQLETRNATLFVIPRGDAVLKMLEVMLSRPKGNQSSIILPLILATGRRMTEVLSPRSQFAPGPTEYFALFSGQLKKRNSAPSYLIPLLVPYKTLCVALVALRQRQSCEGMTNQQINQRYVGNLRRDFRKCLPFMPDKTTPHGLRALYCELVYQSFDVPCTKNWLIRHILGHTELTTGLRYGHFRADGVTRGQFGPFLVE